jgi:hypothetical protein
MSNAAGNAVTTRQETLTPARPSPTQPSPARPMSFWSPSIHDVTYVMRAARLEWMGVPR